MDAPLPAKPAAAPAAPQPKGAKPALNFPIYDVEWKEPFRPAPAPLKIKYPSAKIILLAKDPHPSKQNAEPVPMVAPPGLGVMSTIINDMLDDLHGNELEEKVKAALSDPKRTEVDDAKVRAAVAQQIHETLEYTVPFRPVIVQKLFDWIEHYTTTPEPDRYRPEVLFEMRKNRNMKVKPEIKEDPKKDEETPETLPYWDISFFKMTKMLDEDGEPDNCYEMPDDERLRMLELLILADRLHIEKLLLHLRKAYLLATVRGHLPEEIEEYNKMYTADGKIKGPEFQYWVDVYPEIPDPDEPAKGEKSEVKAKDLDDEDEVGGEREPAPEPEPEDAEIEGEDAELEPYADE